MEADLNIFEYWRWPTIWRRPSSVPFVIIKYNYKYDSYVELRVFSGKCKVVDMLRHFTVSSTVKKTFVETKRQFAWWTVILRSKSDIVQWLILYGFYINILLYTNIRNVTIPFAYPAMFLIPNICPAYVITDRQNVLGSGMAWLNLYELACTWGMPSASGSNNPLLLYILKWRDIYLLAVATPKVSGQT